MSNHRKPRKQPEVGTFYVTTFCNFAHRLKDGRPINHECYILDAKKLQAEARGDEVDGSIVREPRRLAGRFPK